MSYSTRRSQLQLFPYNPEIQRVTRRSPPPTPRQSSRPNPPPSMADNNQPLFGQFGTPGSREFQEAVVLPNAPPNFRIDPQNTRMVKENPFCGLRNECPLIHLEAFTENCRFIPQCPNHPDYIKLCLFSVSLAGDAKDWYKCLEPNSITTWEQLRTAFLERFYPTNRTQDWRKKIASFTQEDDESLCAAWTRFKSMLRACPHHEYGENHLNTFFYDGLDDSTKALLDSAVGGQLSKIPCDRVKAMIEEVAKNSTWGGARGSKQQRGVMSGANLDSIGAKIEAMMDKKLSELKLAQASSNVSAANEAKRFSCRICGGTNHDTSYCGGLNPEHVASVNYGSSAYEGAQATNFDGYGCNPEHVAAMGYGNQGQRHSQYTLFNNPASRPPFNPNNGQGNFNQGYNNNQAGGGFPRSNENKPFPQVPRPIPNQSYPTTQPIPNPTPNQDFMTTQLSTLAQLNQTLITQMAQLQTQQKNLETQLAQLAQPPPPMLFPSNPQPNPSTQPPPPNQPSNHHTCKAIFLRSGTSYPGPIEASSDDLGNGPSTGNGLQEDVEHKLGGEVEEEILEEVCEEKKEEEVEKRDEVNEKEKKKLEQEDDWKEMQEWRARERLNGPPLPFPYRAVEKQMQAKFLKFLEHMKRLEMKIPFLEAMEQMPQYAKYLKSLLGNKKRLESEVVNLPEQVSAIVQGTWAKKEKARGPFVLPVTLGNQKPKGALADLGASISLMPMSIAKHLAFELKPSKKSIQLADRSVKVPCGEFEDLPIQVGSVVVPCDFVVLDMVEDPYTPLILGRDALKSLGALIDCEAETITIRVPNEQAVFGFAKSSKEPMVEQLFSLDVVDVSQSDKVGGLDVLDAHVLDDEMMDDEVISCDEVKFDDEKKKKLVDVEKEFVLVHSKDDEEVESVDKQPRKRKR
ncbi:unnamed protein product, partial [Amaranthus hypochondriacus]